MKSRRIAGPRPAAGPVVRWQGKALTIVQACALAMEEHRRGNPQAFVDIYAVVLAAVPGYAEGHNNRGVVLQQMNRCEEALAAYDRAIALKPDYANAHFNRGTVLKRLSRREEALASYEKALAAEPGHVEALNNRGVILQEQKHYAEALASYEKAMALNPRHAEAHNNRGIVLAGLGRMAEAEKMFLQAAALKPSFSDPLFNLANIRTHQNPDDAEAKNLRTLLAKPGLNAEDREQLLFSLAKIDDDCGRYDEAFTYFKLANETRNARVAYDPQRVEQMTDALIEVFTPELLAQPAPFASPSRSPLFIVGMPRSGTTLLASILSNHPAIGSAGELSTFADLALALGDGAPEALPYPAAVRHLSAAAAERLSALYEQRLRRDAAPAIVHVVDKNPLNFRHIGLIALLFPHARIFHCTRHPLATGLSNYFQRFPLTLDYSFDLRNIGHFQREYARLMDHWHRLPNLHLVDVPYEDMVLNTEATARPLVEHLGLEWDPRCLAPHTNPYGVETASQWQVRQPIYQRSLEHWRHYEKYLAPLAEALQPQPGPA